MDVRCVVQGFDRLGEGPIWAELEGRLYWFDITSRRLCWYEPATDTSGGAPLSLCATAAAPRAAGGLFAATDKGLAVIDTRTGASEIVQPIDLDDGYRPNDGKIDVEGRFWWSTMDTRGAERPGAIYVSTPDGVTRKVLEGVLIPNTISVSGDGKVIYVADSKRKTINAHQTDDLQQFTEFAHTRGQAASPDGSAVDVEGYLWNAQWNGARVVRYAPDGSVDRIVPMPVERPTSCAFGGPDLATLYVTSACEGLTDEARAAQPLAGALFAFEPGVKGLALPLYQG